MVATRSRPRPMLTAETIAARVQAMGHQLTHDYAGKNLLVVGLLNGVFMFFADLTRAMDLDLEIAFMRAQSYGSGKVSSGEVKITWDLDKPIRGRHVLLVDDILDTGLTLSKVQSVLLAREPASLRIATLLDKPARRKVDVLADYIGFSIDDHFVVGYGLDADGRFRNLPYVGLCDPE